MRALARIKAVCEWRPDRGIWRVELFTGLLGCMFPMLGGAQVSGGGGMTYADAVVDDFGNLVIVGMWK